MRASYLDPLLRLRLTFQGAAERCPVKAPAGGPFLLADLLPERFCPLLLHTAVPYRQTLLHGGEFKFMLDRETAVVVCPNPQASVALELRRHAGPGGVSVSAEIKEGSAACPLGYRGDEAWDDFAARGLCFQFFNACFTDLLQIAYGPSESVTKSCPVCEGAVVGIEGEDEERKG